MSRWWLVGGLLVSFLFSCVALGQEIDILLYDDFGTGTVNTGLWNHIDLYGNMSNLGTYPAGPPILPAVLADDAEHGNVLHFLTSGSERQQLCSLYMMSQLLDGEALVLQVDIRRNSDLTYFSVVGGQKRPTLEPGGRGTTTSIPATVYALPMIHYTHGNNSYWSYLQGFWVNVPSSSHYPDQDTYAVPFDLPAGVWATVRLVYTQDKFAFSVDGHELLVVPNPYYAFDRLDDWLLQIGDGSSNAPNNGDSSWDNVVLFTAPLTILTLVDTLGISYEEADVLYGLYGEERLQECLALSGGDYDAFMRCLNPGQEDEPCAHLVLADLNQEGDTVTATLRNIGDAPCCGDAAVSVGLSYCMSWIPEYCTIFQEESFGKIWLVPGEDIAFQLDLAQIPEECRTAFAERLESVWTGYEDPDPEDYLGFLFSIGDESCCSFLLDEG